MQFTAVIPQNLSITSSPTFVGLTLSGLSASQAVMTDGSKNLVSADYLNQAVKTTSSPTFVGATLSGLGTNNGVLYNVSDVITDSANLTFTNNATATLSEILCAGNVASGAFIQMPKTISTVGQIRQKNAAGTYQAIFHTFVPAQQTPTWQNVFIGVSSGNFTMNNTAAAYQGTGNVGLGASTLSALTTGYYNFGIGTGAGQRITTGNSNVFVGHQAGNNVVGGGANVGIGRDACVNTTGSSNVGIGNAGLRSNSSGSDNVAIGNNTITNALGAAAICNKNVVIGSSSGYSLSTGSRNVFLGFAAGYRQTTASNLLIVDSPSAATTRADTAAEAAGAIIYGVMNDTASSQTLALNAAVSTPYTLGVTGLSTLTGGISLPAGANIALATTTGTKVGTATNQLLGFYNQTPVDQPAAVADATGAGDVVAQLNSLLARIRELGLIAT